MFGKRSQVEELLLEVKRVASNSTPSPSPAPSPKALPSNVTPLRAVPATAKPRDSQKTDEYHDLKRRIFGFLVEIIDVSQLTKMDHDQARLEIRDVVNEVVAAKKAVISTAEQEELLEDICNDVLGYGPLQPLLANDEIADIMVNGSQPDLHRDPRQGAADRHPVPRQHPAAQRLPAHRQPGRPPRRRIARRSATPACPTAAASTSSRRRWRSTAPMLTIRKFKRDKLTLDQLGQFGAISPEGAQILKIIGRVRCNIVISGGTGSGKTTLLNCLTSFIEPDERIVTCEDTAELQLQQPHVVRLETRPANLEGVGAGHHARSRARTACACGPTASSSARCAAPRRSICCRR